MAWNHWAVKTSTCTRSVHLSLTLCDMAIHVGDVAELFDNVLLKQ